MVPTGVQMDTSHVDPPGSNYQVLSHSAKNQNQMATSVAVGWFWVGVECVMALTLSIVGREPAVAVGYLALGATTYPDISATRRNLGETLLLTFSLIWLFISLPCFPVLVAAAVSGCKALARLLLRTSGPFGRSFTADVLPPSRTWITASGGGDPPAKRGGRRPQQRARRGLPPGPEPPL